jgi:hypothetical protein
LAPHIGTVVDKEITTADEVDAVMVDEVDVDMGFAPMVDMGLGDVQITTKMSRLFLNLRISFITWYQSIVRCDIKEHT